MNRDMHALILGTAKTNPRNLTGFRGMMMRVRQRLSVLF